MPSAGFVNRIAGGEESCGRSPSARYLRDEAARRYGPRALRACNLDPFVEYLQERVDQARPDWIPATVLLREIQERGYPGGISQLKAYLAPSQADRGRAPGALRDGTGATDASGLHHVRRGRSRLLAFVATLGYSRARSCALRRPRTSTVWRECLLAAFNGPGTLSDRLDWFQ